MKQIVDKLNKIARAVDSNVTLPSRKLIIDSLDAITTAFKGTIVNSNLIVDKLDAIAWAIGQYDGGGSGSNEFLMRSLTITVTGIPNYEYKQYVAVAYPTIVWDDNGTWFGTNVIELEVDSSTKTTVIENVVMSTKYKYTCPAIVPLSNVRITKVGGNANLVTYYPPVQSIQIPSTVSSIDDATIELRVEPLFD